MRGKVFMIMRFKNKRVPRFGRVTICETLDENGTKACFMYDHEVEKVETTTEK